MPTTHSQGDAGGAQRVRRVAFKNNLTADEDAGCNTIIAAGCGPSPQRLAKPPRRADAGLKKPSVSPITVNKPTM